MKNFSKTNSVFFSLLVFSAALTAQPVNDNPCGAIAITMVQTGDACQPHVYTTLNPTYLNLALPASCQGFIFPNYPDYWFKFTAISTGARLNFSAENGTTTDGTFGTGANYFAVYKAATCSGQFTLLGCGGRSDIFYSTLLSNLEIGGVYYIRIVCALANVTTSNFGICISTNLPATTARVGINVNQPSANLDVAGSALFRNDVNFQGRITYFGPSEYSQNGLPDSVLGKSPILRFSDAPGKKIILGHGGFVDASYPGPSNGEAGLAVGPGTLQLQYPSQNGGGIAFGYGNGVSAFTQTALLSGTGNFEANGSGSFAGNVGIGAGASAYRLYVNGDARINGKLSIGGLLDSIKLGNDLGNRVTLWGSSGNVPQYGLGIQSATLQLYTDGPNGSIVFGSGNSYNFLERAKIINDGEYGMTIKGRLQLRTGTQSAGIWVTNMANNSNVSFIGLASDNLVGFYGPGGAGWGITMNTTNANVGIGLNGGDPKRPLSFPAVLGEKILLYPGANGEVGIGVYGNELRLHADNPGAKVSFGTQDNDGNFTEVGKFEKNGAYGLSVFGSIWANGTTYASDARFKKNVEPLNNSLEKILQLDGVSYQMKAEEFSGQQFDTAQQVGLLAQDVEKIVPEVVSTGPTGYKAIDYAKLVPLLIESIKTQQHQLDKQAKEIEVLKEEAQKRKRKSE